jgi:aspartate 1-decarboxylase
VGKRYKIFNSTIGNIVINANGNTVNGSASITMPAAFANEVPSLTIVGISTIAWAVEGLENLPNSVRAADIAAEGAEGTGIQIVSGTPSWVNQERYVTTGALVTNATLTYADITGLEFAVNNGDIYEFEALITYNVNATTTGSTWAINGPAGTVVYSTHSFTGAAAQDIRMKNALDAVTASTGSANVTGNLATIKGIVKPTANGTYKIRFASEVAVANAVIVQVGSVLKFKKVN